MAEHPRTESARDHDDTDLIEGLDADTAAEASSGGNALARDVGSQADLTEEIDDPDARTRATKQDDIAAGQAYDSDRRGQNG